MMQMRLRGLVLRELQLSTVPELRVRVSQILSGVINGTGYCDLGMIIMVVFDLFNLTKIHWRDILSSWTLEEETIIS